MSFEWSQTVLTAEKHLSRGEINAAIEEYQKLVNWAPTDLPTLNTLGDLYARKGLKEEATRIFSRVAEAYSHQGFTSKAIALLKKLLRIDPDDLDAAAMLAECYQAQGLRGEAVRQYTGVAEAHKRAGRDDKAFDAYQRLAKIDPSNTSPLMTPGDRWQGEGLKYLAHTTLTATDDEYAKHGDDERVLAPYLKALAAHPDDHETLAAIASICAARGRPESAIHLLCESLARNPRDPEMHSILGSTYLSAGRLGDAERTFLRQLALDGGAYHNLLILGERFMETGNLDRAVEQIVGLIDNLIANGEEQKAVGFLRKVLDCDPEHLASLRMLALIYRRVREDFNLAQTLKALADSALRQGDPDDEAIEALNELCFIETLNELSYIDPVEPAYDGALRSLGVEAPALPCSTPEQHTSRGTSTDFELIGTANRRRSARVSVRLPLIVISDTGGWREFTETIDVSDTGFKLKLAHPLAQMTALSVLLETAKWPETVESLRAVNVTRVIVRHCSQRPGEPNLIGVELEPRLEQTNTAIPPAVGTSDSM